jgi:hypothetical protein
MFCFCRVVYFPAYELLIDDLRDYRFYAEDMLHPSPLVRVPSSCNSVAGSMARRVWPDSRLSRGLIQGCRVA